MLVCPWFAPGYPLIDFVSKTNPSWYTLLRHFIYQLKGDVWCSSDILMPYFSCRSYPLMNPSSNYKILCTIQEVMRESVYGLYAIEDKHNSIAITIVDYWIVLHSVVTLAVCRDDLLPRLVGNIPYHLTISFQLSKSWYWEKTWFLFHHNNYCITKGNDVLPINLPPLLPTWLWFRWEARSNWLYRHWNSSKCSHRKHRQCATAAENYMSQWISNLSHSKFLGWLAIS